MARGPCQDLKAKFVSKEVQAQQVDGNGDGEIWVFCQGPSCPVPQFPHLQSKAGAIRITVPGGLAHGKERRMLCASLMLGKAW